MARAAIMLAQLPLELGLTNAFRHMIHQLTRAQIAEQWTVVGYLSLCLAQSIIRHDVFVGTLAGVATWRFG